MAWVWMSWRRTRQGKFSRSIAPIKMRLSIERRSATWNVMERVPMRGMQPRLPLSKPVLETPLSATSRAMGSVKSMIGHTMPAAGMAAIIRVALSLSNKILPPSLHCEQPREDRSHAPFYINTQTRPWVQSSRQGPRRGAINAFGFGGINVHIVMEETPMARPPSVQVQGFSPIPRPIEPALARESELAAFSCA